MRKPALPLYDGKLIAAAMRLYKCVVTSAINGSIIFREVKTTCFYIGRARDRAVLSCNFAVLV